MNQNNNTSAKSCAISMIKEKINDGITNLTDAYDLLEMFDEDVNSFSEEIALIKLENALSQI